MVEAESLLRQNSWWKHGQSFQKYDPDLSKLEECAIKFKRKSLHFGINNIYIIRGPRQSGKTVWIKQSILDLIKKPIDPESIFYLSCDSLTSNSRKELRRAIDFFLMQSERFNTIYIFLDEITYIKDWIYEVKSLADQGVFSRAVLVVTGSKPEKLKEFSPGRGVERNEYFFKPFSFRDFVFQVVDKISEYERKERRYALRKLKDKLESCPSLSNFSEIKSAVQKSIPFSTELIYLFNIYLKTGGFPKTINNYLLFRKKEKDLIEDEIYERYIRILTGDIKESRSEITAKQILNSILRMYASRYSFQTLTREGEGLTHPTVIDYLELFKSAFIAHIIHAYDFNKKTIRPKAEKKIYIADPFIFHSINIWLTGGKGYDIAKEFLSKKSISTLVEGVVANHLILTKEEPFLRDTETFLWFYYDKKKEIDFVYNLNNNYLGIELKYQGDVSTSDIKKIQEIKNYIILTKSGLPVFENNIFIFPVALFLVMLKKSKKHL